jgi:hypothetical protein
MATSAWLVRHASWANYRRTMSKAFKTAAHFRVHGKNYSGTLVNLFETALARQAEDSAGRKTSKWDSRWHVGERLGKTEISGEHLLCSAGEVARHRIARRFAENDPRRWLQEELKALTVTP